MHIRKTAPQREPFGLHDAEALLQLFYGFYVLELLKAVGNVRVIPDVRWRTFGLAGIIE